MTFSTKRYRLTKWLSIIFSFLFSMLFFQLLYFIIIYRHYFSAARFMGIVLISFVFFFIIYLLLMRKYTRRKKILKSIFPPEWELILNRDVLYYTALDPREKERFKQEIQIFLGEKKITGVDTEVDDECRLLVAASAVIPIFNFPEWEYDRVREILIYPSSFDSDYDFSEEDADILGMVVPQSSSLIISRPALYEGFRKNRDKINVGIHEFIHKVDEEDGSIDGIPGLLMDKKTAKEWLKIMEKESENIEKRSSDISSYALTDSAEFFAVVSEYFFKNPGEMYNRHPELYKILAKIFKQDTKILFKSVIKSMIKGG